MQCGNRDETWFQIVHGIVISLHQIEIEAISRLLSDDWELTARIRYGIYTLLRTAPLRAYNLGPLKEDHKSDRGSGLSKPSTMPG